MEKKESAAAKLARMAAIPQESLGGAPRITVSGSSHVLVEGISALEEYTPSLIAASAGSGLVVIKGGELVLEAMGGNELSVSGHIQAVMLE